MSTNASEKLDMNGVVDSWTREERKSGENKIRSLDGNKRSLRGGDWISSRAGACMTLSVAWNVGDNDAKQYGLTVAHSFTDYYQGVGSSVFAFNSDEAIIAKQEDDGSTIMQHESIKIGKVVSIDKETDSAVFEIFSHIKIEPLAVALSSEKVCQIILPIPFADRLDLEYGAKLITFGASRRGMIGTHVEASNSKFVAAKSYRTNELGQEITTGESQITVRGDDSGGLYIDQDFRARSMHAHLRGKTQHNGKCIIYTSEGHPHLQDVVNRHATYFGHIPSVSNSTTSPSTAVESSQSSPSSTELQPFVLELERIVRETSDLPPPLSIPDPFLEDGGTLIFSGYQPAVPVAELGITFSSDDEEEDDE